MIRTTYGKISEFNYSNGRCHVKEKRLERRTDQDGTYLGAHGAVVLFVVVVLHEGLHVDETHVLGVRDDPVRQQGLITNQSV